MVNNKDTVINKLSDFLDIPLTQEIVERVMKRTSFSFMKKHEKKFGEQSKDHRIYNQFIRKGETGRGKDFMTKEQQEKYFELAKPYLGKHQITLAIAEKNNNHYQTRYHNK